MTAERLRLLVAVTAGIILGAASARFVPWQLAVLVAWDTTVLTILAWVWIGIARTDATVTAQIATREDPSRSSSRLLLVTASLVSLGGVILVLAKAGAVEGALSAVLTVAGLVTVAASWVLVHTIFTLRYADLYYNGSPGGVVFNEDEDPDFLDFAYLAFTIGMTFQVSDTNIQDRAIRRTVLGHAAISYLFGAIIVGVTINVLAGLFH